MISKKDPNAAKDLVFGDDGLVNHMDSSKAFVDMSTVDEYTVKEINQGIKAKGGRYLEAPVSGSKVPAEQGTVSFYVGVLAYTLNPRPNTKSVLKLNF